jgi:LPXTG-motif cell wall-anchored protein
VRVLADMRVKPPPGRAAVLLATAALPLPLHHPGHHSGHHRHKHHRHQHAQTVASSTPHRHRHRRRTEVDLPGLVATTTARDASATRAHAAGDPADTISDFQFAPATITIHVGDTITWTNDGPSPHSATANNRSFDTGVLKKGQSGSHTFTQAGTFTYFCTVHPFMHGTVVVEAANSSSTSTSGSGTSNGPTGTGNASGNSGNASGNSGSGTPAASSSTSTSAPATGTTSTAASSAGTLPLTGMDTAGAALIGLALLGGGVVIRRRVRSMH